MADMTELERRANQYITEHVANGGRREDVLADWIRSDNADLQKYAKGVLVKDLNPDQAAAEVTQNQQAPGSSYMDMAKDMAPIIVPAALGSAAVAGGAYYLGKKKGEGIAPPPSSDFEARKQQLELDRMQAQVETERARAARLTQMANRGQPLQTQEKFSQPTVAEIAADTTSVKVPSPSTSALVQSTLTAEDIQARAAQLKPVDATPQVGAPQSPQATPEAQKPFVPATSMTPEELAASFRGETPKSTTGISETVASKGDVKQAIQQTIAQEIDKPDLRPTYQRNKQNPIGPQAYNWVAGQQGPKAPEVWQNIVGDKNVAYGEFMERYKPVYEGVYGGGYGDPDAFNQPAKNASYRKPSMIPSQIKGAASPAAMGASALAAVIPALAVAGVEGYKGNKEAVNRELKDAWNSLKSVVTWPYDVSKAATKGDFGPLKDVLMSVNPATLLLNEANKNDKKVIQKMIEDERYAAQVGGGRGIAPPSAYQR